MTYPQQPTTPYPQQPPPRTGGSKRPRGWHVAAAITVGLFVAWFIVSALAATCPSPPKPVSGSSSSSSTECAVYAGRHEHEAARKICEQRVRLQEARQSEPTYSYSKKSSPVCGAATGSLSSMLMLGQVVGIIVTAILGWKRRKAYTAYRRSVFAVEDYERRVPPGSEAYVDLATHQMAAAHAANASAEMWLNQGFWFAPSGAAVQQRIDAIRATGARAAAAAQQIEMSQYAPTDDGLDDLAAPDLGGGGDTTSDTPTDADDWMSGVGTDDNDW